jgi:hypothetical protein
MQGQWSGSNVQKPTRIFAVGDQLPLRAEPGDSTCRQAKPNLGSTFVSPAIRTATIEASGSEPRPSGVDRRDSSVVSV